MILKNPVYKGEYCANRVYEVKEWKTRKDGSQYQTKNRHFRPPEEWIRIAVPAIVSPELWETANRNFAKNSDAASRNAKYPYLLTGLLRRAECGACYAGAHKVHHGKDGKDHHHFSYRCTSQIARPRIVVERIGCKQSQISHQVVEDAVWSAVKTMLKTPDVWTNAIDQQYKGDGNASILQQIAYLESQIADKASEDDDLYTAYRAHVFDADEYAARRRAVKETAAALQSDVTALPSA